MDQEQLGKEVEVTDRHYREILRDVRHPTTWEQNAIILAVEVRGPICVLKQAKGSRDVSQPLI